MNIKKVLPILLVATIILIGALLLSQPDEKETKSVKDFVIYNKTSSWGECQGICWQTIALYDSGRLVILGYEATDKKLEEEQMNKIKDRIRSSGILEKTCTKPLRVVDMSSSTQVYLNGKTIRLDEGFSPAEDAEPGCMEMSQILEEVRELIG
jgi:hypothetical protein